MVNKAPTTIKNNRILPVWLMRLVGISSLATAVIGFAIYWFKKYPPRRKIDSNKETTDSNETSTEHLPISTEAAANTSWSNKLLNGLKPRKNKKKMTISLKNTVLWNPSTDVDRPMYGFQENSIQILARLSYLYDIYVIVHVKSIEEKEMITNLLENASSTGGLFSNNEENYGLDNRKIIFCSEEEGKIHIIRHIDPFIHIEGGWEHDDGEEIVKKLKPFVSKIIWILTKRRRESFNIDIKEVDKDIISKNIEISDLLINTSVAKEVVIR